MGKFYDITGQKFSRLIAVRRGENQNGYVMYYCDCDCGNKDILIRKDSLITGNTQSCGCLGIERRTKASNLVCKKYNNYDLSGDYGIGYTFKGEEFYFDLEDYDKIKDHCWNKSSYGYIKTLVNGHNLFLHRLVTGANELDPYKYVVDHINHIQYDNRKENLRIVSQGENSRNRSLKSSNTSGKSGVWWSTRDKVWYVQLKIDGKAISGGCFQNKEDAIKKRCELEEKYYGEFSYDNSMKFAEQHTLTS